MSVADRLGTLLNALGKGGQFNITLYDSIVSSSAIIVEEKKELNAPGWKAKLEWMHNNGFVCEGYNTTPESDENFTFRCTFVQAAQKKKFGQSKFVFVREGKILAVRRSEDAVNYVTAHPFLPTAQTAPNSLRDGTFGFLVVLKDAMLCMTAKDGTLGKNTPKLRPIPAPLAVVYYEPGPVVLFDKKQGPHMEQLKKGWRLGSLVATRVATTCNPMWSEEGLLIVSKPAPHYEDVINIEVYDQTDQGVVFLGSSHVLVNQACMAVQDGWNEFDKVPLWFGDKQLEGTISFSLKIQNAQIPQGSIDISAVKLLASTSVELRSRELQNLKPQFKRTTIEKQVIQGERIETAVNVLKVVGEVALEVLKFTLEHAH